MSARRQAVIAIIAATLFAALMARADLRAQTGMPPRPSASWELEIHAGGLMDVRGTGGSGSLPVSGALVGNQVSITSFLFGEGSRLVNQNQAAALGAEAAQVRPLDPVLLGTAIRWQGGAAAIGGRLSRALRGRLALEVEAGYEPAASAFTGAALADIERTRSSAETTIRQALASSPVPSSASVVTTIDGVRKGSRIAVAGTLIVHARDLHGMTPYAAVGGGVLYNRVDTPTATLTVRYELGPAAAAAITGTETVALRYAADALDYTGIVGGGVKYRVGSRWGVRLDGRARLLRNGTTNRLDTGSSLTLHSTGSPFPLVDVGALQFSAAAPLTGAPIADASTFTSTGIRAHVLLSAGLFWRF